MIINNKSRDFFFLKRQEADVIIGVVITLIQKKLPKYVDASPFDIQVMTPTRKGLLGVERLNVILQRYLNPPDPKKEEKEANGRIFRTGDKVMQIKNNYQLDWEVCTKYGVTVDKGMGIFNGDMGIIREISSYKETLTVEYDEKRQVEYPFELLDELELDKTKKYAIVMGNEVKGVQQEVINHSDGCIEIPQYGTKHSLNVSVTTGIVIWDLFKKLH